MAPKKKDGHASGVSDIAKWLRRYYFQVEALLLDIHGLLGRSSAITQHLNAMEAKLRGLQSMCREVNDSSAVLMELRASGINKESWSAALKEAFESGHATRAETVRDQQLIPRAALAKAWAVPVRELVEAERRHELFSLRVGDRRYYPAELLHLERRVIAVISVSLYPLSPGQKFIFWRKTHGNLQGQTIMERLASGHWQKDLEAVLGAALRYSDQDRIGRALETRSR